MALVKSNYPTFSTLLDEFFHNELGDWRSQNFSATQTTLPKVNIKEDDNGFDVEMAAPGMKKDDFKIELDHNLLTISSEKKEEQNHDEGNYSKKEFSYQSFQRSFTLPQSADGEKIHAAYEDGILHIAIPKKEEAKPKPPKSIAVA